MVVTQAEELEETGSWSTGVFQMLSAGRAGQAPMVGDWASAERANRVRRMMERSMTFIKIGLKYW